MATYVFHDQIANPVKSGSMSALGWQQSRIMLSEINEHLPTSEDELETSFISSLPSHECRSLNI
jgi:hypothetical protein